MAYEKVQQQEASDKKLNKCQSFLHFLYHKEKGKSFFIGRTCVSWILITIFYIIFYSCLAGYFIGMLSVLLFAFVDKERPHQTGYNNLLRFEAGINIKPTVVSNIIGSSTKGSKFNKEYLNKTLEFFKTSFKKPEYQPDGVKCDNSTSEDLSKFCIFPKSHLGPCQDPETELYKEKMCVYARINNVYGWLPDIKNSSATNNILIECTGQNPGDTSSLGRPSYHPGINIGGKHYGQISNIYFPYANVVNYTSPMVAIQFPEMRRNLAVLVKCYLVNIKNNYGDVRFEVMMITVPDEDVNN